MVKLFKNKVFLITLASLCWVANNVQAGIAIQSLIQRYGQPTITNHLPNGNTVYVFTVQTSYTPPMTSNPTTVIAPGGRAIAASIPSFNQPTYRFTQCTLVYETNRQGEIVREEREGPGC